MSSGRGLCVGLITRLEESYRVLCVSECDRRASTVRRSWSTRGCWAVGGKKLGGNTSFSFFIKFMQSFQNVVVFRLFCVNEKRAVFEGKT